MRTFIIGSKNLSVDILMALIDQGHEVLGAFTRDSEPGMKIWHEKLGHKSLRQVCSLHQIPVYEGVDVNGEESKAILKAANLDIVFSCFWGQIIRKEVLDIPRLGIFNLHTAYLPINRGSRPIPWSLIRGHDFTGLTIHKMHPGVDNGPIVNQVKIKIGNDDTAKSLYDKVTQAGAELFRATLPEFAKGTFKLISQIESESSYQPRGEPFGGQLNPWWTASQSDRFVRAFDFPPFRGHRNWPNPIGTFPKVYCVLDNSLPSLTLSGDVSRYKTNSIGSKEIRSELKRTIQSINLHDKVGLHISTVVQDMFPLHDILTMAGIHFCVSRLISAESLNDDLRTIQPGRYENGLLEIPAVSFGTNDDISKLLELANHQCKRYGIDIFVPIWFEDTKIEPQILQEISGAGYEVVTFTEVYHHFDTDYENISA